MWQMKATAVTVLVLGSLMFGAVVAYAGWSWNAKVDIGGTKVSTSRHDRKVSSDQLRDLTLGTARRDRYACKRCGF